MAFRLKQTWKIEIQYPGDNKAIIEFARPKRNADLKDEAENTEVVKRILDLIVGVEGLENEDGTPMTPDDLRACDDESIIAPIFWGYVEGKRSMVSEEENKKKFIGIVS